MFEKVKKAFGKGLNKCKAMFLTAIITAMSCFMAVSASAADTSGAASVDTTSLMKEAGDQLTAQFGSMVSTIIPVILGILGSGLVIFGIFALIKLAKKIFGKVAG